MQKIKLLLLSITILVHFNAFPESHDNSCYSINDPFENYNRKMFWFNKTLDKVFIRPVVGIYIKAVPQYGQDRVHSFFNNLRSPLTFVNNIIQGDGKAASVTLGRFIVNTFLGVGGILDFASLFDDMDEKKQTFDDTLSKYDIRYGQYLILPLLSPTTTRGAFGKIGDVALNPINYALHSKESLYYHLAETLDLRIQYNDLIKSTEEGSVDHYGKVRSMYIQYISRRDPNCPLNQYVDYSEYD
jgi:phospholipid-binding lipoprotein MlaA